jgi:fluoride ion exporter CrcB/FEX
MLMYLWVALGSAIGGVARFWLSDIVVSTRLGGTFPFATLVINATAHLSMDLPPVIEIVDSDEK